MVNKVSIVAVIIALIVLVFPSTGNSGLEYLTGEEKGFWSDCTVVIARIVEANPRKDGGTLKLEVEAVAVTENLVPTSLSVEYYCGVTDSALSFKDRQKCLVAGKNILVALYNRKDGWHIYSAFLDFMPSHVGVMEVSGLEDPEVGKVLNRIKKIKGNQPIK